MSQPPQIAAARAAAIGSPNSQEGIAPSSPSSPAEAGARGIGSAGAGSGGAACGAAGLGAGSSGPDPAAAGAGELAPPLDRPLCGCAIRATGASGNALPLTASSAWAVTQTGVWSVALE